MKILFITDNFLPHIGGSRVYSYNICKNLPQGSVVVLTRAMPGAKEFDSQQGFKIYRINLTKYEIFRYLTLFINGLFIGLKEKVSIIHCGETLPTGLVGFILSKILRVPYIIYTYSEEITTIAGLRTEGKILRFVLKRAVKIVVTCSFVEDLIIKLGATPGKTVKILPAVENELLESGKADFTDIKKNLGIEGKRLIITLGRLVKRKGHSQVIKALPEVIKNFPNLVYLIIGSGPEEAALRELARNLDLSDYVLFHKDEGRLPKSAYYVACDLFIMPNRVLAGGDTEGFGIVFWEAAALGKPVIGGNSGGVSDSIINGVTGITVNSENIPEISSALIKLLSDEAYAKSLGRAGMERVRSSPSWQDKAGQIYKLSEEIVCLN